MDNTDLWDNPAAVAFVEKEVERAVTPFIGMLTEERLEEMRNFLRDALLAHPTISRFTALAVPGPAVQQSAALSKDAEDASDVDKAKRTRGGEDG